MHRKTQGGQTAGVFAESSGRTSNVQGGTTIRAAEQWEYGNRRLAESAGRSPRVYQRGSVYSLRVCDRPDETFAAGMHSDTHQLLEEGIVLVIDRGQTSSGMVVEGREVERGDMYSLTTRQWFNPAG